MRRAEGRALPIGFTGGLAVVFFLAGCAADAGTVSGAPEGDTPDGGTRSPSTPPPAGTPGECDVRRPCGSGLECQVVRGYSRCVPPGYVDPSDADASTPVSACGACPAPGVCRTGRCVMPDPSGAVCEFDDACTMEQLCIAGHCTSDPRDPGGCMDTAACPIGLSCEAGRCVPTPGTDGCVADRDCPMGAFCEAGRCLPRATCDHVDPDLSGRWDMATVLRMREALPGWLAGFLDAVSGPFRFIAGDVAHLDTGLPGFVDSIVEAALRSFADAYLPPWARDILGAIADLNDILSTWTIDEEMVLSPGVTTYDYTGTHDWRTVHFTYRGHVVSGRPEDIIDWRFTPSTFDAHTTCGLFAIDRHDVNVSIGAIIAWIVDAVTYEATGGRFRTVGDALDAATAGFCSGAASAVGGAVSIPGADIAVEAACDSALGDLTDQLVDAITMARVGFDAMTLKGSAPIESASALRPGVWEGTLLGGDFTGDFTATR